MNKKKLTRPVIKLLSVTLCRGSRTILKNLSWEVLPGECWVVMGANGAGKSSLFEMILGYLWPQDGSVQVLGADYGKTFLPEIRQKIGLVAPWVLKSIQEGQSVREVVASGLEGGTLYLNPFTSKVKTRVRESLKSFSALNLEGRIFSELSSGEQLKVLLARAWIHQPAILILDEPFSMLDFVARLKMYSLLEVFRKRFAKLSILMATHHLEDVRPFFTRALFLKKGKKPAATEVKNILNSNHLMRLLR